MRGLLWLEPMWIMLVAPSILLRDLLWDPWVHPWAVAALFLFWPLRLLCDWQLAPATPLNKPIYLLLLWAPVGLWASVNAERSWQALGYLALGIALYFALLNWSPTQRRPWLIVVLFALLGVGLPALGIALFKRVPTEFLNFSTEFAKSKPLDLLDTGETVNPNVLAGTLLLPIPLFVALALRNDWARRRWIPLLLLAPAGITILGLLISQSRGAFLAMLLSVLLLLILCWPWFGIVVMVVLVTAIVVFSWDGLVLFAEAIGSDGSITSLSGRWQIWLQSLQALSGFPVTGIGIGTFDLVMPTQYPLPDQDLHNIPHAHNLFLQISMDLGIPGVLLFAWLLVAALLVLVRLLWNEGGFEEEYDRYRVQRHSRHKQRQQRRDKAFAWALAAGVLTALVAMILHGLVDAVTWGTKLAFAPWLLFSLTSLLYLQANSDTTFVEDVEGEEE